MAKKIDNIGRPIYRWMTTRHALFPSAGDTHEADEGRAAEEEDCGGQEEPGDCSAEEGTATPRGLADI